MCLSRKSMWLKPSTLEVYFFLCLSSATKSISAPHSSSSTTFPSVGIYRRLPVKIIGIIPSLPLLNYRPVAFLNKEGCVALIWQNNGGLLHSHELFFFYRTKFPLVSLVKHTDTQKRGDRGVLVCLFFSSMFSCEIFSFFLILFSQDPSVTQVRQAAPPGLEEYNPFTDAKPVSALLINQRAHMSNSCSQDLLSFQTNLTCTRCTINGRAIEFNCAKCEGVFESPSVLHSL